jgi:hypothetical protein
MPHTELQPFIDAAKQQGAGDEFLASLLIRRGWRADDVYDALAGWWERGTGVNIPARGRTAENSRDAFLYLLAFSTLATWACALGSLWFRLIEHWLPDAVAHTYYNFRSTVTWQMAAIAVALPIYLVVMRVILRETRANPDRVESGVRKWLTYIALLLAAIGVVSDLICFVQYFLMGGLTSALRVEVPDRAGDLWVGLLVLPGFPARPRAKRTVRWSGGRRRRDGFRFRPLLGRHSRRPTPA